MGPTEDVGAAMVGRSLKTGEEDVEEVGSCKDVSGEAGYSGGNEATKEELDLYEDPCNKHACTISQFDLIFICIGGRSPYLVSFVCRIRPSLIVCLFVILLH